MKLKINLLEQGWVEDTRRILPPEPAKQGVIGAHGDGSGIHGACRSLLWILCVHAVVVCLWAVGGLLTWQ